MKKKYQKPSIVIVELEISNVLLAGSGPGSVKPPKNYEQIPFTDEDCDPA